MNDSADHQTAGPSLGDAALINKGQPVQLSATSEPVSDVVVLKPQAHAYKRVRPTPEDVYLIIEVGFRTGRRKTAHFDERLAAIAPVHHHRYQYQSPLKFLAPISKIFCDNEMFAGKRSLE